MNEEQYMQKWAEGFEASCAVQGIDVNELLKSAQIADKLQELYGKGKDWWKGLSSPTRWSIGAGAAAALPQLFKTPREGESRMGNMLRWGLPAGVGTYLGTKYLPGTLSNLTQNIGRANKPVDNTTKAFPRVGIDPNDKAINREMGYPGAAAMNRIRVPEGYDPKVGLTNRQKIDIFSQMGGPSVVDPGVLKGSQPVPYSEGMDPVNTFKDFDFVPGWRRPRPYHGKLPWYANI